MEIYEKVFEVTQEYMDYFGSPSDCIKRLCEMANKELEKETAKDYDGVNITAVPKFRFVENEKGMPILRAVLVCGGTSK